MSAFINGKEIVSAFINSKQVQAIYKGTVLIWESALRIWKGKQIWKNKEVWKH